MNRVRTLSASLYPFDRDVSVASVHAEPRVSNEAGTTNEHGIRLAESGWSDLLLVRTAAGVSSEYGLAGVVCGRRGCRNRLVRHPVA